MIPNWPTTPSPRQLRAIRAWFGIKQPDFARRCSISHSALADYELARRNTSNEVLVAIGIYVKTLEVKFNGTAIVLEE
jgi:predicted transcriptional regulator